MTSVMTGLMLLIQVPLEIGDIAVTTEFITWHRRFGTGLNRPRSAVFEVFLVLSPFLRFGADLHGIRTFAYIRL